MFLDSPLTTIHNANKFAAMKLGGTVGSVLKRQSTYLLQPVEHSLVDVSEGVVVRLNHALRPRSTAVVRQALS